MRAYSNSSDTNAGSIDNLNPLRYRGYYWDRELCFYYCLSRYYDPAVCRFISPDDISYLDPESINGLNLYAYCLNNPVNYYETEVARFISPNSIE